MARIRKARKRNRKIESDGIRLAHPVVIVANQVNLVVVRIQIAAIRHLVQVRMDVEKVRQI